MKLNMLTILLFLSLSNIVRAEEVFKYLGTYDNVKSTDTGHCYGTSVSIWELNDKKVIGLLNVDLGLCGDPPCSILKGAIDNNKISFKTSVPIYNELYSFNGDITTSNLSGSLNGSNAILKASSFKLRTTKNITKWCVRWSKVSRCGGVKDFCQ